MTTLAMRKKLAEYLQTADVKKVRALYTLVEDEIETPVHDFDEATYQELERRSKSFRDGSARMYTWEETKEAARKNLEAFRKENNALSA